MKRPRGTRDLYGKDLHWIRKTQKGLRDVFGRYGYEEIETPVFEKLELFEKKSGSEVIEQIYHFEDKSQRKLALRPELTAPSIRFYNNSLKSEPKPLKIFYLGPCFRYERPQSGRWRQFRQAGVELIGSDRPEADAEVIALAKDAMDELGLENYSLQLGHIALLRKILGHGGISRDGQDPILRAIDSEDEERMEEELKVLDQEIRDKVKKLVNLRGEVAIIDEAESLVEEIPGAQETIEEFRAILKRLDQMGVEGFEIDLGIARGLEYYTGSVFEIYSDDVQIGGGGRYDGLIESLGGESTPAVGVGFGVDRIARALEREDGEVGGDELDAMILPIGEDMLEESLSLSQELRAEGFEVDVDLMGRSLGKGLSHADSRNAEHAIIVGSEEVAEGRVTIRDMKTGEQEKVFREAVSKRL